MKIPVAFDEEDLKQIRELVFQEVGRAIRVALREGLIHPGPGVRAASPLPAAPAPAPTAPAAATTAPTPPTPPTPVPAAEVSYPEPPGLGKVKPQRKDLRKIIPCVQHRPHAWIEREEAVELIGGDAAAKSAVSVWIFEKQIGACIVTNAKPPHKGLPGRVHVDKEALMKRNALRLENAKNPRYAWRKERKAQRNQGAARAAE